MYVGLTRHDAFAAAARALLTLLHRIRAAYRRQRDARITYDELRRLDDRTLHDLGFERSEIRSVAAELVYDTEPTRVRAVLASYVPM